MFVGVEGGSVLTVENCSFAANLTVQSNRLNGSSHLFVYMENSSVVQTGVKSLGCEKSTAQPSPIHS